MSDSCALVEPNPPDYLERNPCSTYLPQIFEPYFTNITLSNCEAIVQANSDDLNKIYDDMIIENYDWSELCKTTNYESGLL